MFSFALSYISMFFHLFDLFDFTMVLILKVFGLTFSNMLDDILLNMSFFPLQSPVRLICVCWSFLFLIFQVCVSLSHF